VTTPFLLSEDKALRQRIQGIVVMDQRADADDTPRQVGVWFGQPDQEERKQSYPYITIDMIDVNREVDREMRGKVNNLTINAEYLAPDSVAENTGWEIDLPIPVSIEYQITTYARQPRHDRELLAQLLSDKLPFRFGSLVMADGTVRRLDVVNVSKRDATEQAKRLFMNAITVRVSSEVSQDTLRTMHQVLQVKLDALESQYAGGTAHSPRFTSVPPLTIE
jgi:hypothetical protein